MRNHKVTKLIALLGAVLFFSACTWTEPTRVEAYHGDAVNSITKAQVYDPMAAANPSADPVDGTDGQRMEAAMELVVPLVVDSAVAQDWFEGK